MRECDTASGGDRLPRPSDNRRPKTVNLKPPTALSVHELDRHGRLHQAGLDAALEEEAYGLAAALAVVEGPVVDVHADERVGLGAVEAARVLHCVVERSHTVLQSVCDAVAQMARNFPGQS